MSWLSSITFIHSKIGSHSLTVVKFIRDGHPLLYPFIYSSQRETSFVFTNWLSAHSKRLSSYYPKPNLLFRPSLVPKNLLPWVGFSVRSLCCSLLPSVVISLFPMFPSLPRVPGLLGVSPVNPNCHPFIFQPPLNLSSIPQSSTWRLPYASWPLWSLLSLPFLSQSPISPKSPPLSPS